MQAVGVRREHGGRLGGDGGEPFLQFGGLAVESLDRLARRAAEAFVEAVGVGGQGGDGLLRGRGDAPLQGLRCVRLKPRWSPPSRRRCGPSAMSAWSPSARVASVVLDSSRSCSASVCSPQADRVSFVVPSRRSCIGGRVFVEQAGGFGRGGIEAFLQRAGLLAQDRKGLVGRAEQAIVHGGRVFVEQAGGFGCGGVEPLVQRTRLFGEGGDRLARGTGEERVHCFRMAGQGRRQSARR